MLTLQIGTFNEKSEISVSFQRLFKILLEKSLQTSAPKILRFRQQSLWSYWSDTTLAARYSPSLGSSDSRSDKAYPGLMTLCSSGAFETFYLD